jgi:hypothetical protein
MVKTENSTKKTEMKSIPCSVFRVVDWLVRSVFRVPFRYW